MTKQMQAIKAMYEDFKVKREANEIAFEAWDADLENEELEKASDEAYEAMWDALNAFAAELESFTGGQVTQADAKLMARNPKYSARLDTLMARVA